MPTSARCEAFRLCCLLSVIAVCLLVSLGTHAAETGPIRVGAVSTLTGPFTFPESTAAAKAVFDRVNSQGGINGRRSSTRLKTTRLILVQPDRQPTAL